MATARGGSSASKRFASDSTVLKLRKIPAFPINYLYPYITYYLTGIQQYIFFSKDKKQQHAAILARGFPEG